MGEWNYGTGLGLASTPSLVVGSERLHFYVRSTFVVRPEGMSTLGLG